METSRNWLPAILTGVGALLGVILAGVAHTRFAPAKPDVFHFYSAICLLIVVPMVILSLSGTQQGANGTAIRSFGGGLLYALVMAGFAGYIFFS